MFVLLPSAFGECRPSRRTSTTTRASPHLHTCFIIDSFVRTGKSSIRYLAQSFARIRLQHSSTLFDQRGQKLARELLPRPTPARVENSEPPKMKRFLVSSFTCLQKWALLLAAGALVQANSSAPLRIGPIRQLFVDEFLIASKQNVSLRLNNPATREVVLRADKPWEGQSLTYPCVFKDGDRFRLYYRASGPPRWLAT